MANPTAKIIRKIFPLKTARDNGEMYRYDSTEGIFKNDGERLVRETTEKILGSYSKKSRKTDVVSSVQDLTYFDRSEFALNPHLLVVANGVLNLKTLEMKPFSPLPPQITRLPVAFDPTAKFEDTRTKNFFEEVCTPVQILQIQEVFGYVLWRDHFIQKGIMLVGEGGNGKTTLICLLKDFLGAKNVSGVRLQDLDLSRFAVADLQGKMANLNADVTDKTLKDTGRFKMLTGGDLINAEKKFMQPFDFVNYAKLIFAVNQVPQSRDLSVAFMRRWLIMEFLQVFPENDPKTDKNILKKMNTPKALSALLNWSLKGLTRLLKNQGFTDEPTHEQTKEEYLRRSSSVASFIMDMIEEDFDSMIPKDELYREYVLYCQRNGRTDIKSLSWFSQELVRYCPVATSFKPHGKPRSWKNIWYKNQPKNIVPSENSSKQPKIGDF